MNRVKEYAEVHGSIDALKAFADLLQIQGIPHDKRHDNGLRRSACIVTYPSDSEYKNGSFTCLEACKGLYSKRVYQLPEDQVKAMQAIIETI
jgi:hypothetical protein